MQKYIAKLWLEPKFCHFDIDEIDFHLKFRVASKMKKILKIKEQDKGYIVVDAEFDGIGVEEDYIDIKSVLNTLGIRADDILNTVQEVRLR